MKKLQEKEVHLWHSGSGEERKWEFPGKEDHPWRQSRGLIDWPKGKRIREKELRGGAASCERRKPLLTHQRKDSPTYNPQGRLTLEKGLRCRLTMLAITREKRRHEKAIT